MRGTMLYAPCDIRVEERAKPEIQAPADAIIRISAACGRHANTSDGR